MELATLANRYRNFYAPTFTVRVGGKDLMRELAVAVSQVEVDLMLGAASRFTFNITDCYSLKLHAFQNDRGVELLEILKFGAEVEIALGYGDASSTPTAVCGIITEIATTFPEGGSPELTISGYDHGFLLTIGKEFTQLAQSARQRGGKGYCKLSQPKRNDHENRRRASADRAESRKRLGVSQEIGRPKSL